MAPSLADASLQTGHVGLNVVNLEKSLLFYTRVFGFEVLAQGTDEAQRWAFLGRGGRPVLTLWQQSDASFSARAAGLHHLAFQVDSIDDVRTAEAVLRELGVEVVHDGLVSHGEGMGSGGVYFTDPDGVRLEVYAPTGAEHAPAPSGAAPTCGFF